MSTTSGIIVVNVVGTNEKTRQRKFVNKRFNLSGVALNNAGIPIPTEPGLTLALAGSAKAPDFPAGDYAAAQATGNADQINAVIVKHAEAVEAWQSASDGGTTEMQIAKAVHAFCIANEGFLAVDGDGFVLSLDNLDVKSDKIDGSTETLYTVAGTAVFGR